MLYVSLKRWDAVEGEREGEEEGEVTGLAVRNVADGEIRTLPVPGIFIAAGMIPNTELVKDLVQTDDGGYIIADETGRTSCPGFFAAGDIRTKTLRQVVTAVSDGANAVNSVQTYLLI